MTSSDLPPYEHNLSLDEVIDMPNDDVVWLEQPPEWLVSSKEPREGTGLESGEKNVRLEPDGCLPSLPISA